MPSKIKFIESKREKARKWLQFANLLLPVCCVCVLLLGEWRPYHTRTQHLIPWDSFCLLCEPFPPVFGEGHRWRRLWGVDWVSEGLTHTNYPELNEPFIRICLFVSGALLLDSLQRSQIFDQLKNTSLQMSSSLCGAGVFIWRNWSPSRITCDVLEHFQ